MRRTFKASFEQPSDAQRLLEELLAAGYPNAVLALSGATHSGRFTRQRPAVTLPVYSEPEASRALGIIERAKPARLQDEQDDSVPDRAEHAAGEDPGAGGIVSSHPKGS